MEFFMKTIFYINFVLTCLTSKVLRPRGVSLMMSSFYDPDSNFSCLDGSGTYDFSKVNDDYCHCKDGTDEPGTAACSNGKFHCENAGYQSEDIPSAYVNDGVCDCCDASDEYLKPICENRCDELGKYAKEEAERQAQLQLDGDKIRILMCKEGAQVKTNEMARLEELSREKETVEQERQVKVEEKDRIEEQEKAALEKYKTAEDELKAQKEQEELMNDREESAQLFKKLDSNSDGFIKVEELQSHAFLDVNNDGQVSEEELKFYFPESGQIDLVQFITATYQMMKPHYMREKLKYLRHLEQPQQATEEAETRENLEQTVEEKIELAKKFMAEKAEPAESTLPEEDQQKEDNEHQDDQDVDEDHEILDEEHDHLDEDHDTDEEDDYDTDDLAEEGEARGEATPVKTATEKPVPQYDEETQALVDAANAARDAFKTADDRLRTVSQDIQRIQKELNEDYGFNGEFRVLKDQCFELTDREYTYKLCVFRDAIQKSLNGGHEVNLGKWGHWVGDDENKYFTMKYEEGLSCWNGPRRNTEVRLSCGSENKLTAVSEPNRCEYLFAFTTPALCYASDARRHLHEEL